ncbi:hypothetical protein SUDANB120_05343 [Streptomyces sp. enrichment culture]|uniref:hypothetical protein n=1 Tax=Streptomyces TaxID=1883 RepID=UPI00167672E6|nr:MULTISPECIES: hypothetical protein [Streptomyces]MBD3578795.1 hypothetical protein [Streptomyces sp. KD18]GGS80631.1 hypothetical protein GCM10010286_01430 [Streptomyces toxytricini]
MASTQTDESGGSAVRKTRFVATPRSSQEDGDTPERMEPAGSLRKRTLAAGLSMGVGALLCFLLSAGIPDGQSAVRGTAVPEVSSLREQLRITEAKTAALPKADDAERGLTAALKAAGHVAKLQNDYRYLTPKVAADGGKLDAATSQSTLRNLIPYFAPSVHREDLGPWYLLAGDKDVPAGVGIPMSFDSGFEWAGQVPYLVNDDGTIAVTWLATETRTAAGEKPAVLAWARADYDLVRNAFVNIRTGTTVTGKALEQEVRAA